MWRADRAAEGPASARGAGGRTAAAEPATPAATPGPPAGRARRLTRAAGAAAGAARPPGPGSAPARRRAPSIAAHRPARAAPGRRRTRRSLLSCTGRRRRGIRSRSWSPAKAPRLRTSACYEERGVLRRLVPHWLRLPDLRPLVLGFEEAGAAHGGAGALYVRLRRPRPGAARRLTGGRAGCQSPMLLLHPVDEFMPQNPTDVLVLGNAIVDIHRPHR